MPNLASVASPQPQPPRLLACVADDVTRETIDRLLGHLRWKPATVLRGGIEAALQALPDSPPPAVLLVDLSDTDEPLAAMDELASLCPPTVKVLAIGNANDIALYRELLGMGVVDYLVKPVSGDALREALQRAAQSDETPRPNATKKARIVACIGARGGVGTTTCAIGAGWCIASEHNLRVALLDLDLHFGNLALSLDLEPGRGLREALEHPERTDGLLVAGAMTGSDARFRVLAAEEALEADPSIEPDAIDALLNALSADFDCVVIDLPRRLDGPTRRVLAVADAVALVTDLSLPGMRDTMRLLAFMKTLRPDSPPLIVANRVGGGCGEIPRADFERGIGGSLDEIVPFDAKAAASVAETGKPLPQAAKSSKAAVELGKVGRRLAGGAEVRPRSLLRRLLG